MASSAQSGLSRRRGGAASSPANGSGGPTSPALGSANQQAGSYLSSSTNSSRPTTPQQPTGHKVAFDERDMESGEDRIMPKLTLMEEVLLLGLKDKQVSSHRSTSLQRPSSLRTASKSPFKPHFHDAQGEARRRVPTTRCSGSDSATEVTSSAWDRCKPCAGYSPPSAAPTRSLGSCVCRGQAPKGLKLARFLREDGY